MDPSDVRLVVPPAAAGERLDVFLSSVVPDLTRSQAKRLIDHGRVAVDGFNPKAGTVLREGERVDVRPFPPNDETVQPDAIPVELLHSDDDVIVLVKPSDIVVHPAAGHPRGTLVNALAALGLRGAGGDPRRPGIVHRLDRGTSGVMVVARNVRAHAHLGRQFHDHSVERSYIAIVQGSPPDDGRFETPYRRHPVDRKRFTSRAPAVRRALTAFRTIERSGAYAMIEARLGTGRTHQIRVHMADHGFPVLGDPLYGRPPRDARGRLAAAALGRQALHARTLGFHHPGTGEFVRFEAPPPEEFVHAWSMLASGRGSAVGGRRSM